MKRRALVPIRPPERAREPFLAPGGLRTLLQVACVGGLYWLLASALFPLTLTAVRGLTGI